MRGEVLGVERRRRWSDERERSILAAVGVEGASVRDVARRHEIMRSRIQGWRRDPRREGVLPAEAPARCVALSMSAGLADEADGPDVVVEIGPRGGRGPRVPAGFGDAALMRLIRVTSDA